MLEIERKSISVGVNRNEAATGLTVIAVGGDDSLNHH